MKHFLTAAVSLAALTTGAMAEGVWNDPLSFGRMVTGACITAAGMDDKADRIAFIEQQFDMTPTGAAPDSGDPDLETGSDITIGWQPVFAPSIFCAANAPGGLYDEAGVQAILDWISQGAEVPKIDDGMYGPIQRTLVDGRSLSLTLTYDPQDTLIVMGIIQ
ncbi:MAG: hypothetical protein AAF393_02655 [Pseudomonadota bacterium]